MVVIMFLRKLNEIFNIKLLTRFLIFFGLFFIAQSTLAAEYANPLKHSPYVQLGNAPLTGYDGGHDQFQLIWQTTAGGGLNVDYFEVDYSVGGLGATTTINFASVSTIDTGVSGRINHYVDITGLDYDTDYFYTVRHMRNGALLASYSATYHTRLEAGDNSPFTFIAYGDSASGNPPTNFISVQDRINATDGAFSILLGDNTYTDGTHSEWDLRLDQTINSSAATWNKSHIDFFGWGNHDIISDSGNPAIANYDSPRPSLGVTSPVAAPVGETAEKNYSFDYGSVHFLTFDTSNAVASNSRLDNQLDWAVADLEASDQAWKVVFVHYPIISISYTSSGPTSYYYQQVVSRLKNAGADVIMVGHAHTYERSYPLTGQSGSTATITDSDDDDYARESGGLVEVVSGLGGKDFHNGNSTPNWLAFARTGDTSPSAEFGFTEIDVTTNSLTFNQIAASDGDVIDSFTMTGGLSSTDVSLDDYYVDTVGSTTIEFTTSAPIPADGKIVVTFPTSLGSGFTFNSGGTTAIASSSGLDGSLSLSISGNVATITRSGGTVSDEGAKSITLTHVQNPDTAGSTGVYQIKTTANDGTIIDQETAVTADTITAVVGDLSSVNVEPASSVVSVAGDVTITFNTENDIPSNGKIVVTFPTSLGSGFTFNSGGTTSATSQTMGGSLSVSIASNVVTITRSGGTDTTGGETESITLSHIQNPTSTGSTGTYAVKTTDSTNGTIDEDDTVGGDIISSSGEANDWWDDSWLYRKKITFNNSSNAANLVNFPVRVTVATSTDDYNKFKASGDDVRFVDADGVTVLNYEIENWNTASTSNMWVKVPQIDASSNTDYIYMYYGNSGASAGANATGVWDSNYVTVYHFKETSGTYSDSTSYAHTSDSPTGLTSRSGVTSGGAGPYPQFAGGASNSYVSIADSTDYDMSNYTIEAYVNKSSGGTTISTGNGGQTAAYPIVTKGMAEAETQAADVQFFLGTNATPAVVADFENYDVDGSGGTLYSQNAPVTGATTLSNGSWYHVAQRFDNSADTHNVYLNGVQNGTISTSYVPNVTGTHKVGIGTGTKAAGVISAGGGFAGYIDEVRISNIARSNEWLAASASSTANNFNTYASEEGQGAGALTSTNVEPASLSAGAVGNITVSFTTENDVPSDGKIVITLPTSLGTGFVVNSGGTTATTSVSGFDGNLTTSASGNTITITRSGGTSSSAGAKSITLSYIKNPNTIGSTGVYSIRTTTSADVTIDQDLAVSADTIVATSLSSTNVEPASLIASESGNATISFTTTNYIPSNGKIVVTFPTSLGSGFVLGTPSVVSASGINGLFTVATSSNVMTITRTGTGNSSSAGAKTIVVSGITNPNSAGSTGVYQIKTTNSSGTTIDEDASVSADTIVLGDVDAPLISNVASSTSYATATVTWNTDESSNSKVSYGTSSGTYTTSTSSASMATSHSLGLTGLSGDTTYYFVVVSADSNSNTATSSEYTLLTTTTPDTTPPAISSVASSTTATTATITWTTDESATSTVNYGATSSYGTASTSSSLTTSHSITLSGLSNSTTYHFQVSSGDASYNYATSSDLTFTTTADLGAPVISSISSGTPTSSGTTITWTTDENSSSKVIYGPSTSYAGTTTETDTSTRVTSHSVTLSGLASCTLYHFKVVSRDSSLNSATSTDSTFNTSGCTGSASIESAQTEDVTVSAGGSVSLSSGDNQLDLTIPADVSSTTSSLAFQAKIITDTSVVASVGGPTSKTVADNQIYDIKAYSDAVTIETSFDDSITITLSYSDSDVSGLDESSLKIYRYDGSVWEELSDCVVDTNANTVTCTTDHFSVFGLFGDAVVSASVSTVVSNSGTSEASRRAFLIEQIILIQKELERRLGIVKSSGLAVLQIENQLKLGTVSPEVIILQKILNNDVDIQVAPTGPGSKGNETDRFGSLTKEAVIKFQLKYNIISTRNDPFAGIVGPNTRAKLNSI